LLSAATYLMHYWSVDGVPVESSVKSSSSRRIVITAVSVIVICLCIGLGFYLGHYTVYMFPNVDAGVYSSLALGYPTYAFAYTTPGTVYPCCTINEWVYDDVKVSLVYLKTLDDLKMIAGRSFYVSALRDFYVPPIPFKVIDESDVPLAKAKNYLVSVHNPSLKYTGRGVRIAIIDSGIDYLAPVFFKNCSNRTEDSVVEAMISFVVVRKSGEPVIWRKDWYLKGLNASLSKLKVWEDSVHSTYGVYPFFDTVGHGTAVASVISAQPCYYPGLVGVAPNVSLIIVKVFPDKDDADISVLMNALYWLYKHADEYGIDIVVMSLGSEIVSSNLYSSPLNVATCKLAGKNVIIVVASGNSGAFPGTLNNPASSPCVIAVGSWNAIDGKISEFTSLPPQGTKRVLEFLATGYLVWTYLPENSMIAQSIRKYHPELKVSDNVYLMLGTSFSAPACAGVLATWREYLGYLDFMSLERAVKSMDKHIIKVDTPLVKYGVPRAPSS